MVYCKPNSERINFGGSRRRVNDLLCLLVLSAVTACSAADSGNCSSAIVSGSFPGGKDREARTEPLFEAIKRGQMLGGKVVLQSSECNATFEFSEFDAKTYAVNIWTARHCSSEKSLDSKISAIRVFFYDGYVTIPVTDEFNFRRSEALKAADTYKFNEAAKKVILSAFEIDIGNQRNADDTGCFDPALLRQEMAAGKHVFCANWRDLGVYRAFIDSSKLSTGSQSLIKESINLTNKAVESIAQSEKSIDLRNWKNAALKIWKTQRMKHYASALEWVSSRCKATEPPLASGDCAFADQIVEIADKYMFEDSTSIVQKALKDGYWSAARKSLVASSNSALSFFDKLKDEEGNLMTVLDSNWKRFGRELLSQSDSIWLSNNVESPGKNSKLTVSYMLFPVGALSQKQRSYAESYNITGMQVSLDKKEANITFGPGDSGSIITAFGLFPVLVLSGVDGKQTSGGASVVPLPEASGTATRQTSRLPNEEESDSGRNVRVDSDSCSGG